ncbi:TPA: acyltransferase [Candidatus Avigastranaerophilus faecigallinarum]|nr:acyltransferase [Candidatus Avigastranaerophilus faecigallinarum]
MKQRIFGIDLIRVIAMFMIMNYHLLLNGSWMTVQPTNTINLFLGRVIVELTVISVNLFALVSGYVGLHSHHRIKRFVDLWLQVLFFSWLVLLYFWFFRKNQLTTDNILHNLFPTYFKAYWYWNGYVILFVLMPILNKGLSRLEKVSYRRLIIGVFLLTSVLTVNPQNDMFNLSMGYSGLWLIILYIYGAYFKRFGMPKILKSKVLLFFIIIINWCFLVGISYYLHIHKVYLDVNGLAMSEFQYNFSLITTLSIFVFLLLIQIESQNKMMSNIITFLGKHSFSAYLLQTNPLVFSFLITGQYLFLQKLTPLNMVLNLILYASIWFFGAIIIDIIRSCIFKMFSLSHYKLGIKSKKENYKNEKA